MSAAWSVFASRFFMVGLRRHGRCGRQLQGMGDWQFFLRDTGGGETYLHWMMTAWGWTLSVAALSLVVALVVGSVMGILRTTPSKGLVFIGNAWTEMFRNIPLLVQIFLWYHVIPSIFLSLRAVPSFVLVVFAIGFFTSSRISEQLKAGIQSLPKGQRYAGLAMGLTLPQTYRYVLLPMAYRIIIPPLTSESMNIIKNSSVVLFYLPECFPHYILTRKT